MVARFILASAVALTTLSTVALAEHKDSNTGVNCPSGVADDLGRCIPIGQTVPSRHGIYNNYSADSVGSSNNEFTPSSTPKEP